MFSYNIMEAIDYAGNEILVLDGEGYTGAVAISTGDRNKFSVEISIRAGVTKKTTLNYDEVVQLFVDSVINGKTCKKQLLFKDGFQGAVNYCRDKYRANGGEPIKYASLEDSDFEKSLIADHVPYGEN